MTTKMDEFKACMHLKTLREVKSCLNISSIYEDMDDADKLDVKKSLDKLTSYLFEKIES